MWSVDCSRHSHFMSVSLIIITYLMGSFKLNIGNNVEQANNTEFCWNTTCMCIWQAVDRMEMECMLLTDFTVINMMQTSHLICGSITVICWMLKTRHHAPVHEVWLFTNEFISSFNQRKPRHHTTVLVIIHCVVRICVKSHKYHSTNLKAFPQNCFHVSDSKRISRDNQVSIFLWPPYVIWQSIIFLPCGFYLTSFFYLFFLV